MATRLTLNVPFIGSIEWTPSPVQRTTAWALYVELVTRVAVQDGSAEAGLVREALASLHSLFPTTRQVLREAGPTAGSAENSVGGIAIAVLNRGLRPFLSKWHPQYSEWERAHGRKGREWKREAEFRKELRALQADLSKYADALKKIAGVKP